VTRPAPPPGVVAAAEQDYHAALDRLGVFVDRVTVLLDEGLDDLHATVDVWLTLRVGSPAFTSFVSAIAIVQLARAAATTSSPHRVAPRQSLPAPPDPAANPLPTNSPS
jgi:hypothetical protein